MFVAASHQRQRGRLLNGHVHWQTVGANHERLSTLIRLQLKRRPMPLDQIRLGVHGHEAAVVLKKVDGPFKGHRGRQDFRCLNPGP